LPFVRDADVHLPELRLQRHDRPVEIPGQRLVLAVKVVGCREQVFKPLQDFETSSLCNLRVDY
jgi:hypothetical protein